MSAHPCRILFVDDSADDHVLFADALRRFSSSFRLLPPLRTGDEVIAYLAGDGRYSDRDTYPVPDLLVLDLKMPRRTGHEVLEWLQSHATLRPVTVVFSASDRHDDISRAGAAGAVHYFIKPTDLAEWRRQVTAIAQNCPNLASRPK